MDQEEFHRIYERMPEDFKAELINGEVYIATCVRAGAEELCNGDQMTREEFHRLYEQTDPGVKVELIGGRVYVASPLNRPHGTVQPLLSTVLTIYMGNTPGVEVGDNATVLLGGKGQPQPDLYLRILPDWGGQSRDTDTEYVAGAPELLGEIADSTRSVDLHAKKDDYARYGVLEYIVVCLREQQLRWFDLPSGSELTADPDGIYRSRVFPGLWIHAEALLAKDYHRLLTTIQQGLATPEHAAFVRELAAKRSGAGGEP
jgi:Uma2 family endonuclease